VKEGGGKAQGRRLAGGRRGGGPAVTKPRRRKRPLYGRGGLLAPLGVIEAQEQLGNLVLAARAIEGSLDTLTRGLAAEGPPAEGSDEKAKRLRSYLLGTSVATRSRTAAATIARSASQGA
jgi:hypothetical protein